MPLFSLYLSFSNLGNYLSWYTRSAKHLHEQKVSTGKRKQIETYNDDRITCHGTVGCWQTPPQDIMEEILQKMGLIARTRLVNVCMSWSSLARRAEIRNAPQLPWLAHPQTPNTNHLTFSSLSEGQVVNLELPKRFRGQGKFHYRASSKGWLIILQENRLAIGFDMFLYNPISRAQHKLPSLNAVPYFRAYQLYLLRQRLRGHRNAENFPENFLFKVVLSSPNISECIVAAIFEPRSLLGLCRPGDNTWTVFEMPNPDEDNLVDILFSQGILYGLVDEHDECTNNGISAGRILNFGDDKAMTVELKFVYGRKEVGDTKEYHDGYTIELNQEYILYLLESTTNSKKEILLIYQMLDCLFDDGDDVDYEIAYKRTTCFLVYKVDLECGNFHEVQNLGDQIIFLAENSSSMSFPASEFKLPGNCIYFATKGYDTSHIMNTLGRITSREIGIYNLDNGKIKRPFPSVTLGSISSPCQLSWFCPSF